MRRKFDTDEFATLSTMKRSELLESYEELYQLEPPSGLSRPMLERSIAYALQERAYGGLSLVYRRQLLEERVTSKPRLSSESVLVREWHGVHHTVRIKEVGVEYRGQHFRSLSAVASLIRGHRTSGNQFFGLASGTDGQ